MTTAWIAWKSWHVTTLTTTRVPCVHMERVGVRRLRERLSEYVRRAEAGGRIEVTDRGRTVARLEPRSRPEGPIEALIADGLGKRPVRPWAAWSRASGPPDQHRR